MKTHKFSKKNFRFRRLVTNSEILREHPRSFNFFLIADFLNSFDMSCRSRLSTLNVKLTSLERKVDFLEAKVSRGGETPT